MLETVVNWLVGLVESWGYMGIFTMMFVESTFFPFPSEIAMIPAGYLAFQGKMNPYIAVLMGFLGSVLGAYFNYYFARVAGLPFLERYGKYFFVKSDKLEKAMRVFRHHGEIATFVCRLVPVVRQLISVPAGLARMNLFRFGFYTGLGAGIWVAVLVGFGWLAGSALEAVDESEGLAEAWGSLKQYWSENQLIVYASIGIPLALIVGVYVYMQRRKRKRDSETGRQGDLDRDSETVANCREV